MLSDFKEILNRSSLSRFCFWGRRLFSKASN